MYQYNAMGGQNGQILATAGGLNTSGAMTNNMHLYNRYNHSGGQVEVDYVGGGMMTGEDHLHSQYRARVFDGMALSDAFLEEYYSSVST